jgi:hypothetical protein
VKHLTRHCLLEAALAYLGFLRSRRLPLVDALIVAVTQIKVATLVRLDEPMRAIPLSLSINKIGPTLLLGCVVHALPSTLR